MPEVVLVVIPPAVMLDAPVPLRVILVEEKGLVNVNVALIVSVMSVVLAGEVPLGKLRV